MRGGGPYPERRVGVIYAQSPPVGGDANANLSPHVGEAARRILSGLGPGTLETDKMQYLCLSRANLSQSTQNCFATYLPLQDRHKAKSIQLTHHNHREEDHPGRKLR